MVLMNEDDTKRIIELLEELAKWKRFEGAQLAKKVLSDLLAKDAEKLVYQYSDGKSSRDIAILASMSDFSVRNYWKKWNVEGLVVPSKKYKGRYERVFSLEDFGIEIPRTRESLSEIEMQNQLETGGNEGNE